MSLAQPNILAQPPPPPLVSALRHTQRSSTAILPVELNRKPSFSFLPSFLPSFFSSFLSFSRLLKTSPLRP